VVGAAGAYVGEQQAPRLVDSCLGNRQQVPVWWGQQGPRLVDSCLGYRQQVPIVEEQQVPRLRKQVPMLGK